MDLMAVRRRVISNSQHLVIVQSGNTEDSTDIAHFITDAATALQSVEVTLPYKAAGYTGVTVTACGVNLLKCSFTDGTAHGITYTQTKNAAGEVTQIKAVGKTSQSNAFRNINYVQNTYSLHPGKMAFNGYSDQVNLIGTGITGNYTTVDGYSPSSMTRAGCNIYNIDNVNGGADWARVIMFPYAADVDIDTIFYPMICLKSDKDSSFAPYDGTAYTVSFDTIYGGKVDLLAGKAINEYNSDGTAATPSEHTFTAPSGITSKAGVNNIWANAGSVTIKYWGH